MLLLINITRSNQYKDILKISRQVIIFQFINKSINQLIINTYYLTDMVEQNRQEEQRQFLASSQRVRTDINTESERQMRGYGIVLRHGLDEYQVYQHTRAMLNEMRCSQNSRHLNEPVSIGQGAAHPAATIPNYIDTQSSHGGGARQTEPNESNTTTSATTTTTSLNNESRWANKGNPHLINSEQVQRAYQSFVEAEHMSDALMPTISSPIPVLDDRQVDQYFKDEAEEQKQPYKPKALGLDYFTTSETLHVSDEKFDLLEVGKRKQFSDIQSVYELQDQYNLNEKLKKIKSSNTQADKSHKIPVLPVVQEEEVDDQDVQEAAIDDAFVSGLGAQELDILNDIYAEEAKEQEFMRNSRSGRRSHQSVQAHRSIASLASQPQGSSTHVILNPKVYQIKQFLHSQESSLTHMRLMIEAHGVQAFHKNPYIVAMLFHGVAKGTLLVNKLEGNRHSHGEESKQNFGHQPDQWETYFAPMIHLNPVLKWGQFLPTRVRKLILNLSRYNFQHLVMQEHEDPCDANHKFLSAFRIFIENTKNEDLFSYYQRGGHSDRKGQYELNWNFQQVIKVLFEGQTRNAEIFHSLRTIFKPVYAKLGLSSLLKLLNEIHQKSLINESLQLDTTNRSNNITLNDVTMNADQTSQAQNPLDIDKARCALLKPIDRVSHVNSSMRNEVSSQEQVNFDDIDITPKEVSHDMFKRIQRLTPVPACDLKLEPITSIFDEIQGLCGHRSELPDCKNFVNELFSINMLTVDIYAPAQKPRTANQSQRDDLDSEEDPILRLVGIEANIEMRKVITEKVIQLCKTFMQSLFTTEMPFTVRVMIKTLVDKTQVQEGQDRIATSAHLIADLIAACWLSNGFRWAECVGATPALPDEALLQGHVLLAARLVVETCLACTELPVPATGNHPTFDIPKLNQFIFDQKVEVLSWYEEHLLVLDDAEMAGVRIPSFEDRAKQKPDEPLYNAGLMRIGDLATLLQLIMWKFIEERNQNGLMDKKIEQFNHQLEKISKCQVEFQGITATNCTVEKVAYDRLASCLNKLITVKTRNEQAGTETDPRILSILDYWTREKKNDYKIVKQHNARYKSSDTNLFDRQWTDVAKESQFALHKNEPRRNIVEEMVLGRKRELEKQGYKNKGVYMMQHELFRLILDKQNQDIRQQSSCPPEFFEDQYLVFFKPREAQDNELDRERTTLRKNLLWNFVSTHYNPKESQECEQRLKSKGPFLPEPDTSKSNQAISQSVSSQALSLMKNKYFFSAENEDEETLQTFQQLNFNSIILGSQQANVAQSAREETKVTSSNHDKIKLKFCDVLERFSDHFEHVMSSYSIQLNRIYERRRLHMGSRENVSQRDVYDNIPTIEVLLQLLEEDVMTMESSKTDLLTEILLLKLYYQKLTPQMQQNLIECLKLSMAQEKRIAELVYVQQSGEIGLAISQLRHFSIEQIRRHLLLEAIFQQVKVNRFLTRNWSKQETSLSVDELRNYIASSKHQNPFPGQVDDSRSHTITTNNVPSVIINATERQSIENASIKKDLIDFNFTKLQTYVDECDCLAFKSSIKQASSLQQGSQQQIFAQEEHRQILKDFGDSMPPVLIDNLSYNLLNEATEECVKEVKRIIINQLYPDVANFSKEADHFGIYEIFQLYKRIVTQCLNPNAKKQNGWDDSTQQVAFFDKVEENILRLLIKQVWEHVKFDKQVREIDVQIQRRLTAGLGSYQPPDQEAFDLLPEEENDLYQAAIETLIQVNYTDDVELKALTVERSIKIAVESYEASNLFQPVSAEPSSISQENLTKLILYILHSCYKRKPDFTLYMDLVYVCMILQKGYNQFQYVRTVAEELGHLLARAGQQDTSHTSVLSGF